MESFSVSTTSTKFDISSDLSDMEDFQFTFYWNSSQDPLNPCLEKEWEEFKIEEQTKLNVEYSKYMKDKNQNICHLTKYKIDFDKFIQINKEDQLKIRRVKMISYDIEKEKGE